MKNLTKANRIIWNNNLEIILKFENQVNTSTGVPSQFNSFESDNLQDVEDKIAELGLIEQDEA